jgi:hypothetical protein
MARVNCASVSATAVTTTTAVKSSKASLKSLATLSRIFFASTLKSSSFSREATLVVLAASLFPSSNNLPYCVRRYLGHFDPLSLFSNEWTIISILARINIVIVKRAEHK